MSVEVAVKAAIACQTMIMKPASSNGRKVCEVDLLCSLTSLTLIVESTFASVADMNSKNRQLSGWQRMVRHHSYTCIYCISFSIL